MRLISYVVAIALIMIYVKPTANERTAELVAIAGLLFFGARLTSTTYSFVHLANVHNQALGALDHVPEGARLVSLVRHDCDKKWFDDRLAHLPAMAIVRRNAFSNDQWQLEGAQLLHSRYPVTHSSLSARYKGDSSQFVNDKHCVNDDTWTLNEALAAIPRDQFDYVWLLEPPSFNHTYIRGMNKIWQNGNNELYKIKRI